MLALRLYKTFSLSVFLFLTNVSYAQKTSVYDCPAGEKFEYVEKAALKAQLISDKIFKTVDTGTGLAFRYIQEFDCPNSFDEEISIRLIWSVPETDTSFNLTLAHKDSLKSPIFYYVNGPGPSRKISQIIHSAQGLINGKKMNGAWIIECNLEMNTVNTRSLMESKFKLEFSHSFTHWQPQKGEENVIHSF